MSRKRNPRFIDYYVVAMTGLIAAVSAFWAVHRALDGSFWSMAWAFSTCVWTIICIKEVEKRL